MPSPEFTFPLIALEQTHSTSSYLQSLSNEPQPLTEFTTATAAFQTAGKGQRGNSWESERGKNLLFSFILYPHFLEVKKQFMLSKAIAIAIRQTLAMHAEGFTIKWPNDVYWNDKKICGTLIENDLQAGRIVKSIVGIGININQQTFQSPAPNPVSLFNITGSEHQPAPILQTIMAQTAHYYGILKSGDEATINTLYSLFLYRKAGFHPYSDAEGRFEARIVEVLPQGTLVLEDRAGKHRNYMFKEVQYVMD